jgi:predicted GTPase
LPDARQEEAQWVRGIRQLSQPNPSTLNQARISIHPHGRRYRLWRTRTLWLTAGESGLGKSTLVNTLFQAPLYPDKENREPSNDAPQTVAIQQNTVDIEENGVRLQLSIIDTPGFGDLLNNEEWCVLPWFLSASLAVFSSVFGSVFL